MPMLPIHAIAVAAAVALLSLAAADRAHAQNGGLAGILLASDSKAHRHRPAPAELGPIACFKGGCHHIPVGCHPEMTFDYFGNPTGYETAVCPDGRG
jgi:hypothetical protein